MKGFKAPSDDSDDWPHVYIIKGKRKRYAAFTFEAKKSKLMDKIDSLLSGSMSFKKIDSDSEQLMFFRDVKRDL